MKLTTVTSLLIAGAVVLAVPATLAAQAQQGQAQGQAQPPKPEAKPEPKAEAAPSFAGKWTVNVETPNGAMQSALELKIDGKKVAGTMASPMGEAAVEGEIAEGKLTFWITIDAGGNNMSVTFVGTMQKDGSLAGTFDFGQGEMPWTAVRVKG